MGGNVLTLCVYYSAMSMDCTTIGRLLISVLLISGVNWLIDFFIIFLINNIISMYRKLSGKQLHFIN